MKTWVKEPRLLGSGWERHSTSNAEDVEEGHIMPRRKDAQPVAMESQRA